MVGGGASLESPSSQGVFSNGSSSGAARVPPPAAVAGSGTAGDSGAAGLAPYTSAVESEESVGSTDGQIQLPPASGTASGPDGVTSASEEPSLQKRSIDILQRIMAPLRNFGFGRRTVWEGGVGIFVLSGITLGVLLIGWVKNFVISSRYNPYNAVFEFGQACGISIGTPVRIRGIKVGSVVGVRPSLERIDVTVEMGDAGVIIPRNSRIEVNQSGLIAETLIDITPQLPVPEPKYGPLEKGCSDEGVIVCHREHIKGEQGVSLDELVSVCTKLMKEVDQNGTDKLFAIADKVGDAIKDAAPLLAQAEQVAAEIAPLLRELRDGEMFNRVEALFDVVTTTAADIRRLNKAVITEENTELLRQSVATLTKTLKHIESISKDISQVTGDPKTSRNLRQLIQSLSRMVAD